MAATKAGTRLRLLHVVRQYRPSIGGMESYVEEMIRRQSAQYEIVLMTLDRLFDGGDPLPRCEETPAARIVRVPFRGRKNLFFPMASLREICAADLIHVHGTDQLFDVVSALARVTKAPLFVTTHGLYFHTETLRRVKQIYLRTVTRFSLSRAHRIYACSGNDRRILADVGIESCFLPNPIRPLDEALPGEKRGDLSGEGADLVYIGRLSPNKRVDRLIAFAAALKAAGAPRRVHLIGADQDGLGDGLVRQAAAAGLRSEVLFHGFVPEEELLEICARSGFIVSASAYEGFGLSMVEGMSVGLLPVMQPNAAFREIHQRSGAGLLIDFAAPDAAAATFLDWQENVTQEARKRARAFALAQSWDKAIERTEADYQAALAAC